MPLRSRPTPAGIEATGSQSRIAGNFSSDWHTRPGRCASCQSRGVKSGASEAIGSRRYWALKKE